MRFLKINELYDGMYVRVWFDYQKHMLFQKVTANTPPYLNPYQIVINEDGMFYTIPGDNWRKIVDVLRDSWFETPETIKLNRESKINQII